MTKVGKDSNSEDMSIHFDDETLQGQFSIIRLDDHAGLELLAQICDFYESKGYNVRRAMNTLNKPRLPWWKRILGRS